MFCDFSSVFQDNKKVNLSFPNPNIAIISLLLGHFTSVLVHLQRINICGKGF